MSIPQAFKTAKPRVHRRREIVATSPPPPPPPPPPPGPVLSAVDLDAEELQMSLEFSGFDIELIAFDPTAITVNDPETGSTYQAVSAEIVSGFFVSITLEETGASSGEQTLLNVAAGSGIVDADTGLAWVGCSDLVLPFP